MNSLRSATACSWEFHAAADLPRCFLAKVRRRLLRAGPGSDFWIFFVGLYPLSARRRMTVRFVIFFRSFFGKAVWMVRESTPFPGGLTFLSVARMLLSSFFVVLREPTGRPSVALVSLKVCTASKTELVVGCLPSVLTTRPAIFE